jgi:uncharacterized ferritin-like protein (DUF455 family)
MKVSWVVFKISTIVGMQLRHHAFTALCLGDPQEKVVAVQTLWHQRSTCQLSVDTRPTPNAAQTLPGRPERPRLIPAQQVPTRKPFTPEGLAALVHAVCHIEFNAINLALDAVWRFNGMPEAYYDDWLRVAFEESQHFELLHTHLQSLGYRYGDFDAHDGLWQMCEKTANDVVARMALVPRTLEARGLDATPLIQTKLRKVASPGALRAVEILDIILRDEVGHVAIGNHWYRWLCEQQGLDPVTLYGELVQRHDAPKLKPPFNNEARKKAGFTDQELAYLLA